jgi:YtkA-like
LYLSKFLPDFVCPAGTVAKTGKAKTMQEQKGGICMRVRFVFWLLLAVSCTGVLVFAALYQPHDPAVMQVRIDQQPAHNGFTTVELRLTDPQGVPIENAHVSSTAWMTNMVMQSPQSKVIPLGQGKYTAQLLLYMAGPWEISVTAQADGFTSLKQTLFVEVI